MGAIANIAIQDGEASPVTHTFYPLQSAPDAVWRENVSNLALIGQPTIKLSQKHDARSGLYRTTVVMTIPALETAGDQNSAGYTAGPKVAYFSSAKLELIHHNRSSVQFRENLRVLLADLLGETVMIDANDNLLLPY